MLAAHGVHHIELEPGDAVCWHSSLWHYSPPNRSDQGRIGIAGVYTTPEIIERGKPYWSSLLWAMREGQPCPQFPPEPYPLNRPLEKMPEFPPAEA